MIKHIQETSRTTIQQLWSGYGAIYRISLPGNSTIIHKYINPPTEAPDSIGHSRKIQSYINERLFYSLSSHPPTCPIPSLLPGGDEKNMYLSDLEPEYPVSYQYLDERETRTALKWLASFHAFYWDRVPEELASQGSYWYLDTRLNELEGTKDRLIYSKAHILDQRVKVKSILSFVGIRQRWCAGHEIWNIDSW
jgi:hypothetical protein